MMMLKKFRCLVLVLALILVVVSGTTFAAKKPVKLVLGHVFTADHFYNKAVENFKKLVEKNSKGKIVVDNFPACQLGTGSELLAATRSGAQQMYIDSIAAFSTIYPKFQVFQLPYLFRDQQHYSMTLKKGLSVIDQKDLAAKTGARILDLWARPARHLSSKTPVNNIGDLKGLRIRIPNSPLSSAIWKVLGAIPTVIPMTDVYTGLATGTIDGQENPLDTIYAWKLYEQQKYIAFTSHLHELVGVIINNNTWNRLTSSQKKILIKAARKSGAMSNSTSANIEKEMYDKLLQKGIKFTKPDLTPFRKRCKTIWSKYVDDEEFLRKIETIK
jgi:tripartite ATP-independent transporter DctP family solute receptor